MRTRLPLLLSTLGAVGLSVFSSTSHAQESAKDGQFSVQRFEPAPGSNNYLSVEGTRIDGEWGVTAGLMFNYARDPFVVVSCVAQEDCSEPNASLLEDTPVVRDLFTWDILASLTLVRRLQVGLRVPLAYVSGANINVDTGGPAMAPLRTFAVGDPMLEGKLRIYGDPKDPFVLGGAVDVSFPVGNATAEGAYFGNSSPVTVGLRGIFDGQMGPLSFGLNLRGVYRQDAMLGTTTVGPEFRYGAGIGYKVSPLVQLLAEGYGGTRFSAQNGTNSLEIDGGLKITPLSLPLVFSVGGGAGVIEGVGVPVARGLVGMMVVNEVGDQDGDGLNDKEDKCPSRAEDEDQFEDDDGCPEDDNDQDRIPDLSDKCPLKPETVNGLKDDDGCPDDVSDRDKDGVPDDRDLCPDQAGKMTAKEFYGCPDADGDNIADKADKCPAEPEDTDGFNDTDGCADPDNDNDGVLDDNDECGDVPEVKNGFKDEDGCPDEAPDRDKDGLSDPQDKCPDRPETFNGIEDDDGCPELGPSLVQIKEDEIKILERVEFATGSDKIQGAKSFVVLDAVVGALKARGDIFLVEVGGHTDNVGPADANRALSQKRAEAVVAYVKSKGVEAHRVQAKGYGPDKPIADNKSALGKQKNRRVEFNILSSAKKPATLQGAPVPAPAAAPPAPAAAPPAPGAAPPTTGNP